MLHYTDEDLPPNDNGAAADVNDDDGQDDDADANADADADAGGYADGYAADEADAEADTERAALGLGPEIDSQLEPLGADGDNDNDNDNGEYSHGHGQTADAGADEEDDNNDKYGGGGGGGGGGGYHSVGADAADGDDDDAQSGVPHNGAHAGAAATDVVCELHFPSVDMVHTDAFPAAFTVHGLKASLSRSFNTPQHAITVLFPNPSQSDATAAAEALGELGDVCADGVALADAATLGHVVSLAAAAGLGHGSDAAGADAIGAPGRPLRLRVEIAAGAEGSLPGGGEHGHGEDHNHADAGTDTVADANAHAANGENNGGGGGGDSGANAGVAPVDVIRVSLGPADPSDPASAEVFVFVKLIKEFALRTKRFLGGFRNKTTGTVSHHASTQTVRRGKAATTVRFHRETQTQRWESRSVQSTREVGVQMARKDLALSGEHDYTLVPRPYFTAHQLALLKHKQAVEVQAFLRICFAARRVQRLRSTRDDALQSEVEKRAREEEAKRKELARQARRRAHPRSREDFDTLQRELEAWRLHEIARIKASGLPESAVQFQLQEVLGKEVVVLQILDRLKLAAAKKNALERTQETLEQMSSPKAWAVGDGDTVDVETPFTRRARELVVLYTGLSSTTLTPAERTDVLLHAKYTAKEFDCELTRELLALIAREEDMTARGRSDQSLVGLRKRIANGFLQFINTPEFNPEAAAFATAPTKPVEILTKPQRGPR